MSFICEKSLRPVGTFNIAKSKLQRLKVNYHHKHAPGNNAI